MSLKHLEYFCFCPILMSVFLVLGGRYNPRTGAAAHFSSHVDVPPAGEQQHTHGPDRNSSVLNIYRPLVYAFITDVNIIYCKQTALLYIMMCSHTHTQ